MVSQTELRGALRRFWGYDSFRPMQEEVVSSLIGGHDVCAVMPTGFGKSLCYQLPAAMLSNETVVVVSPLIALMQDQVAQLTQMGIPSALLNSSLSKSRQARVINEATERKFRLLYLSPERLAAADTSQWLRRVPISFFAIDEAHCISEWGHEFRPEYRKLRRLRAEFPERRIAAFTASATRRVRHDIIEQLGLSDPHKYIHSFYRPNLHYFTIECDEELQQKMLLSALRYYSGENVIVYVPTISKVGATVEFLEKNKIPALPYHGKMNPNARRLNQERWMADEVRILVGTIAFGLGINKPAVRAVIHLALPKSVEQYYQEAGRAGRDGLRADCILLWRQKDIGLLAYFVNQLRDKAERERGWDRNREIVAYAQSKTCKHLQICTHFGEIPKWKSCAACDACGCTLAWSHSASKVQRNELDPSATTLPAALVEIRPASAGTLASIDLNLDLRESLRSWRRKTAKENRLPAYIIMHDTSLDELCRTRPRTLAGLRKVPGFGEKKTSVYGPQMLEVLNRFRDTHSTDTVEKVSSSGVDPELREYLREWRGETAKRNRIRPYFLMLDISLDELCHIQPRTLSALRRVTGFDERKTRFYGQQILDALERFRKGARASAPPPKVRTRGKKWWGDREQAAT
jgi:ATP-dependent DNA helicase RecQ